MTPRLCSSRPVTEISFISPEGVEAEAEASGMCCISGELEKERVLRDKIEGQVVNTLLQYVPTRTSTVQSRQGRIFISGAYAESVSAALLLLP